MAVTFEMAGLVALVAGASGNVGTAVARRFLGAGLSVAVVGRDATRLQFLVDEAGNDRVHIAAGFDLSKFDDVEDLLHESEMALGPIDIAVNAIGVFRGGSPTYDESSDSLDFVFNVNVKIAYNVCRAVIHSMRGRNRGRIVNVGSVAALRADANSGAYAASKAALVRLTEAFSEEVKQTGITVNAVLPGTIDTPANREAMPDADATLWVGPEQVAEVITFLSSEGASAVTGVALPISGKGSR